jgi:MOSC domain-containing protein YiiM
MTATVTHVRTGRVATHARPDWDHHAERTWRTGYVKDEVRGAVRAMRLGLQGDEQFDTRVHGGPDMALLAYAAAHYARWAAELALPGFGPGAFGENLVIQGHDESLVCIGDVYAIGGAVVQVSQPRGPCANISRRWNQQDLLARVVATGRTGWYLRVLEEGDVRAGDPVVARERPHADMGVDRVLRLRLDPASDPDGVAAIAACEALSREWRDRFAELAKRVGR